MAWLRYVNMLEINQSRKNLRATLTHPLSNVISDGFYTTGIEDPAISALCYACSGVPMLEDLLQPSHLLVILVIAVIFFGPKKLPELGTGLANGIRSFKESLKDVTSNVSTDVPTRRED
jgi:sec-independent protein translocase protein TatA